MSRKGGLRGRCRSSSRRLSIGSIDNLNDVTSSLASEYGVTDISPFTEEPVKTEEVGVVEILLAGIFVATAGLLNISY